jgi:hypothetical protein
MLDDLTSVVITLTFNDGTKMRRKLDVDQDGISDSLLNELDETLDLFE